MEFGSSVGSGSSPTRPPVLGPDEHIALRRYIVHRWPGVEADDIIQDVELAFWSGRHRFDVQRPVMPYLFAIARNHVVDRLRQIYRAAARHHLLDLDEQEPAIDEPILARIDAGRLLDRLSNGQHQAIVATKLLGMSTAEASASCGQGASLIRVNVHRGMNRLQRHIRSQRAVLEDNVAENSRQADERRRHVSSRQTSTRLGTAAE